MAQDAVMLVARAVDELGEALIVWAPAGGDVMFANRVGREHFISPEGRVVEAMRVAAAGHRCSRRELEEPLPSPLELHGFSWYVRTQQIAPLYESIVAHRPTKMSELELIERFRQRYGLPDRKTDVLRYLLRGRSTLETAKVLRIAYPTVRRHIVELMSALGVSSRYEIFRLADRLRNGLPDDVA